MEEAGSLEYSKKIRSGKNSFAKYGRAFILLGLYLLSAVVLGCVFGVATQCISWIFLWTQLGFDAVTLGVPC